ncbi:MAG: hypothetical protein LQ350_008747, partial [Teloschistes chrysophthalmus]
RKYFDSGDYALSKAGKASEGGVTSIGSQHPLPENIPHLTSPNPTNGNGNGHTSSFSAGGAGPIPGGQSGSPVKEASFLHRGQSVDEQAVEEEEGNDTAAVPQMEAKGAKSPPAKEGLPIRWQQ